MTAESFPLQLLSVDVCRAVLGMSRMVNPVLVVVVVEIVVLEAVEVPDEVLETLLEFGILVEDVVAVEEVTKAVVVLDGGLLPEEEVDVLLGDVLSVIH